MKIRSGFVSNSSTTSYTCQICGATESGWDSQSMGEFGYFRCVNDHYVCIQHMLEPHREPTLPELRARLISYIGIPYDDTDKRALYFLNTASDQEYEEWCEDEGADWLCDMESEQGEPEYRCPICQFVEIAQSDMVDYLLKTTGIPKDEIFQEVKKTNRRRKKLYDTEYITLVCLREGIDISERIGQLKEQFVTYSAFRKWVKDEG